jgi:hypothetical protein
MTPGFEWQCAAPRRSAEACDQRCPVPPTATNRDLCRAGFSDVSLTCTCGHNPFSVTAEPPSVRRDARSGPVVVAGGIFPPLMRNCASFLAPQQSLLAIVPRASPRLLVVCPGSRSTRPRMG